MEPIPESVEARQGRDAVLGDDDPAPAGVNRARTAHAVITRFGGEL